jgi:glycosyltransferase involved in cell wall biosynthesis
MLTAAVRDLHRCYPSRFLTDVRTPFPALWENNPYLTPLPEHGTDVKVIDCGYPLIHNSNNTPHHFIHAFIDDLNKQLNLDIHPTVFKGDIHICAQEKSWSSQVCELTGDDTPFWIVVSGGKYDFTTKWWPVERYQQIIDHFQGEIQFVQVGAKADYHPPLDGVIDLRGQTDLRQLVRLVYHAQGVLCPVTLLMHLAAAVEVRDGVPKNRPCVVVAGGREPSQWEAYPHHQYVHTNGSLLCCDQGGCWKSRTKALGDGSGLDSSENLCVDPVGDVPRCMHIITSDHVISRIETYFSGGVAQYLDSRQHHAAETCVAKGSAVSWSNQAIEHAVYKREAERYISLLPPYPNCFNGRGVVICAGGVTYFTNAWILINMLRHLGCALPIELWYLGRAELDKRMSQLITPFGVKCIDALIIRQRYPVRDLTGWGLKPYAILHSSFKEVLFLDADNLPVVNPEYLFETPEFSNCGAIFWPDLMRLSPSHAIWSICGIEYRDEPEFESGQMLLDKERSWSALLLTMWYNEHGDFFYRHLHGDKDTFHMAFRKLHVPYTMPHRGVVTLDGVMCQHDFQGRRIFQHRNRDKWSLRVPPKRIRGYFSFSLCVRFLESLRRCWSGLIEGTSLGATTREYKTLVQGILRRQYDFHVLGAFRNRVRFSADGRIDDAIKEHELSWRLALIDGQKRLQLVSKGTRIAELRRTKRALWKGWYNPQRISVQLTPVRSVSPKEASRSISLVLRAPVNGYTGYGLHAIQIATDLGRMGCDVKVIPTQFDERFTAVPDRICRQLQYQEGNGLWELLLHPPTLEPTSRKRTVYFTMWESTSLPARSVEFLNRAECVIVPCKWNAVNFAAAGVTRPVHIVPLGINTEVFRFSRGRTTGPCIFGTGGRTAHGGVRKGVEAVIAAFLDAFRSETDVRLLLKIFPDCEIPSISDSRIIVLRAFLSERQLARWYRSITCFVSAARGEGWGLMQHQALATGRPLITVEYGGVKEYFQREFGYSVDYTLVPARDYYRDSGYWAEPIHESLVQHMRQVYRNRNEAAARGELAARAVAEALLRVLENVGMVRRARPRRLRREKVITMVLYDRPHYTKLVLDALRQCEGINDYLILVHLEPGDPAVLALAEGIDFARVHLTVNPERLGIGRNTYRAWEHGFNEADFIIHIEDDTVPSRDCLKFMEHCRGTYQSKREIFSVSAYNRSPCEMSEYYVLARRRGYTCWLLGLWKDRWDRVRNDWSPSPSLYAEHLNNLVRNRAMSEIYPLLSRSQNIGAQKGIHVPSPEWHHENQHTDHWAGNYDLHAARYKERRVLRKGVEKLSTNAAFVKSIFGRPVVCEKSLVIRARFDGYTGYGLHAQQVFKDLRRFGHDFGVVPIEALERTGAPLPARLKKTFSSGYRSCKWELILHPPNIAPRSQISSVYFTMWETTRLPPHFLANIQRATAVIVPSKWNAECFAAQGVAAKIFICPLGIDPRIYHFCPPRRTGLCVFGAAGNISISGRTRKGIDSVIAAFKGAFPTERDVLLKIKAMPNDRVIDFQDDRIEVVRRCFTETELAAWYSALGCFVSGSTAEAWGLMQLQAMAVGRPLIASAYGGLTEFFDPDVGYCVEYTIQSPDERYAGLGSWANPSLRSLMYQMRRVYENQNEATRKGECASQRAQRLTWEHSNRRLEQILKELGAL